MSKIDLTFFLLSSQIGHKKTKGGWVLGQNEGEAINIWCLPFSSPQTLVHLTVNVRIKIIVKNSKIEQ